VGVQRSDCVILIKYDLVVELDTAHLFFINNKLSKENNKRKEIIKTICDSVNHTCFLKEHVRTTKLQKVMV